MKRLERLSLLVILAAAALFGFYQAWLFRHVTNPDFATTLLMARHIATGRDFPVFFYGQAYLGSVESYVSALLCLVFGISSIVIASGHALCAFLILPVIWAWARLAAGPRAGLAAVLFAAFYCPNPYLIHGGYAVCVLCSAATLWLACRAIERARQKLPLRARDYFLLGLFAGLGWWTHQLVIAALVTAGLLLFVALRWRVFSPRVWASGVAGFLTGSLPFWVWNIANDWATWKFQTSFGRTSPLEGLRIFFQERYAGGVGLSGLPVFVQHSIVMLGFAAMIWLFVRRIRRREAWIHPLAWMLFTIISALIACRTHFITMGTFRYLSPQLPIMAVAVGCAIATLRPRTVAVVAWIVPLLAAWSGLSSVIRPSSPEIRKNAAAHDAFISCAASLATNGIRHAYLDGWNPALSFYSREQVELSGTDDDLPVDRYPAFTIDAELDEHPGFLADEPRIRNFLAYAGGTARKTSIARPFKTVTHSFTPPDGGLEEIPPRTVAAITDHTGRQIKKELTDRCTTTIWTGNTAGQTGDYVELSFAAPVHLGAIRIFTPDKKLQPPAWRLEHWDDTSEKWQPILNRAELTPFIWSGPRIYWNIKHPRLTMRFPPCLASRLRITQLGATPGEPWTISEIQLFTPAPEPPAPDIPALLEILRQRRITRLYSDRWEANTIHQRERSISTDLTPEIFGKRKTLSTHMNLKPVTAILVSRDNAPATRDALALKKIAARETSIGPWLLFDLPGDNWKPAYADKTGLIWTGCTVLAE